MKHVIGLTGGIGVGKSAAAAVLATMGAVVVDCDQLGRDVVAVGGSAYRPLVEAFGPGIVADNGEIDRPALASLVFNDPQALQQLNAITHPAIDREIEQAIDAAPDDAVVVLDMAVLVETDLGKGLYQQVLVIEAPLEQRLRRLEQQRGMARADVEARMANQATDDERRARADHHIINDSDLTVLGQHILRWWRQYGFPEPSLEG